MNLLRWPTKSRTLGYGWVFPGLLMLSMGCAAKRGYTPEPQPAPPAAVIVPGSEESLFPIQLGDVWTYDFMDSMNDRSPGSPDEMQVVVKSSEPYQGGTKGVLELTMNGEVKDRQTWWVTADGLYELTDGVDDTPFNPPQLVARFPLKPGESETWTGVGTTPDGSVGKMDSTILTHKAETVDTTLGPVSAIPVESTTTFSNKLGPATALTTVYLRPRIGLVRVRMVLKQGANTYVSLLKLKSHTLKTS